MHEFLREMNQKVLSNYDAVTVGELPHTPDPKKVLEYVSAGDKQLSSKSHHAPSMLLGHRELRTECLLETQRILQR